jgi:hypothetical protein
MQFAFAILDLRRVIHMAVLTGAVLAVHAFGPSQLQAPVDRYLVGPILRTSTLLQHQLEYGAAVVYALGNRFGAGDRSLQ